MKHVVCLDLDGVIIENHESKPGEQYFNIFPQDVQLRPGVIPAFTLLRNLDASVHIVTNQAWITLLGKNKEERKHLFNVDLLKRCRVVQLLGEYAEIIQDWWVSTIVTNDPIRSHAKRSALVAIALLDAKKYNDFRLIWIGDNDSDTQAGIDANSCLEESADKVLLVPRDHLETEIVEMEPIRVPQSIQYRIVRIDHISEAGIKDLYQALLSVIDVGDDYNELIN